jgi:hypothetical protein
LTKYLASFALLASAVMLLTAGDVGAASKPHGLGRCAYAACVSRDLSRSLGKSRSSKARFKREQRSHALTNAKRDLRRKRRAEDAVSRLQDKIARQRLERRAERKRLSRDALDRSLIDGYGDSVLTCRKARLFLLGRGFYRVSPLDCQGRTFTFLARENGDTVRILLDPRHGRIISTNPL